MFSSEPEERGDKIVSSNKKGLLIIGISLDIIIIAVIIIVVVVTSKKIKKNQKQKTKKKNKIRKMIQNLKFIKNMKS